MKMTSSRWFSRLNLRSIEGIPQAPCANDAFDHAAAHNNAKNLRQVLQRHDPRELGLAGLQVRARNATRHRPLVPANGLRAVSGSCEHQVHMLLSPAVAAKPLRVRRASWLSAATPVQRLQD